MQRLLLTAALGVAVVAGCSTPFRERRTPSGGFCSDMQVVPAGQMTDQEYHRLQPIASDPEARTEAERLESLRKAACAVGADAVIEAVNEEIRTEDGRYASVASGTAVLWVRPTSGVAKPLTVHTPTPATSQSAAEPEPPPPPPSEDLYEEVAPAASAKTPAGGVKGSQPSSTAPAKPGQPSSPGAKPSQPSSPGAKPGQPSSPGAKPSQPTAPASSAKPVPAPKK